jgi:hypothetical protein
MSDLDDFARRVRQAPRSIQSSQRAGINKAALAVKKSVQSQRGYTSLLYGVGTRGARLNVRYDIRGTTHPIALVRATGPFHLIESDTKPHEIKPRRRNRNRRGPARAVATPHGTFARVQHPGTKGKYPWRNGVKAAAPKVPYVFQTEVHKVLRRLFRG